MRQTFTNCYEILEIHHNATNEQIIKAYKEKAKIYHPDKNNGNQASETMFRMIQKAKEILLDPANRLNHDYQTGIKAKPEASPKRVYITKEIPQEKDWAPAIGLGLLGLFLGVVIASK